MGFRFLLVVAIFVCVSINSIYAETDNHRIETLDNVLNKVNSKVRKTKDCQEKSQYLNILKNLENQDYLTQEHQDRINTILKNQC